MYLVAEVLMWVLVGPVYLLQTGLMAWGCLLRVVRAGLVYPSAVEQMGWEYQLQQAPLLSSVRPLPWQQEWG